MLASLVPALRNEGDSDDFEGVICFENGFRYSFRQLAHGGCFRQRQMRGTSGRTLDIVKAAVEVRVIVRIRATGNVTVAAQSFLLFEPGWLQKKRQTFPRTFLVQHTAKQNLRDILRPVKLGRSSPRRPHAHILFRNAESMFASMLR